MADLFAETENPIEILPARKLAAKVAALYVAPFDHFETRPVEELRLGFDGIDGDFHAGATRRSGGREPWYPRGTEMRNERQLSIVAADELAIVAERMGLNEVKPEWIGANLVIEGLPQLSMLPSGTLLFFRSGVTIKVDAQNGPCRIAGRSVAENAGMADHEAGALAFPKAAKRLRGLVAWVKSPARLLPARRYRCACPSSGSTAPKCRTPGSTRPGPRAFASRGHQPAGDGADLAAATGMPSISDTGMMPPAVEVMKTSSAAFSAATLTSAADSKPRLAAEVEDGAARDARQDANGRCF